MQHEAAAACAFRIVPAPRVSGRAIRRRPAEHERVIVEVFVRSALVRGVLVRRIPVRGMGGNVGSRDARQRDKKGRKPGVPRRGASERSSGRIQWTQALPSDDRAKKRVYWGEGAIR